MGVSIRNLASEGGWYLKIEVIDFDPNPWDFSGALTESFDTDIVRSSRGV